MLGLPNERTAAVNLVQRSPAGITAHGSLLHRLAEENLAADAATWTAFITHLLSQTANPSWEFDHYLPDIVRKLKAAEPVPNLAPLIEQAMRLGCTNAPDW